MLRALGMNAPYELTRWPALAELDVLTPEVKSQVKAADWQTFAVAMTVLIGGGYILIAPGIGTDVQLVAAGFIGAVVSYFFGNRISTQSAAATIAASQSGAQQSAQATNGGH